MTSAVQNGSDLVGPDTYSGLGWNQDLVLGISNLTSTSLDHMTVQRPDGFKWQTTEATDGYAFAEFIQYADGCDRRLM